MLSSSIHRGVAGDAALSVRDTRPGTPAAAAASRNVVSGAGEDKGTWEERSRMSADGEEGITW